MREIDRHKIKLDTPCVNCPPFWDEIFEQCDRCMFYNDLLKVTKEEDK